MAVALLGCNLVGLGSESTSDEKVRYKLLPPVTQTVAADAPDAMTTQPTPQEAVQAVAVESSSVDNAPAGNTEPILNILTTLNVRSGPGTGYPVVGQLAAGQTTEITGVNPEGAWWQVMYPPDSGSLAWVVADPQYATAFNVNGVPIVQPPPTLTPLPTLMAPPAQPTEEPTPTLVLPTPTPSNWSFVNIRVDTDQYEDEVVLYGNIINDTNSYQELSYITGTFYDDQNQVIASDQDTYDYWVVEIVPPQGRVPFELTVSDIQKADKFDLIVEAEPSNEIPSPDFEFIDLQRTDEEYDYCLEGKLRNTGGDLDDYLVIVGVLYDQQDRVINFAEGDFDIGALENGETDEFFICIDPLDQNVARHELQALGL